MSNPVSIHLKNTNTQPTEGAGGFFIQDIR